MRRLAVFVAVPIATAAYKLMRTVKTHILFCSYNVPEQFGNGMACRWVESQHENSQKRVEWVYIKGYWRHNGQRVAHSDAPRTPLPCIECNEVESVWICASTCTGTDDWLNRLSASGLLTLDTKWTRKELVISSRNRSGHNSFLIGLLYS